MFPHGLLVYPPMHRLHCDRLSVDPERTLARNDPGGFVDNRGDLLESIPSLSLSLLRVTSFNQEHAHKFVKLRDVGARSGLGGPKPFMDAAY